jgi:hypothetical protein
MSDRLTDQQTNILKDGFKLFTYVISDRNVGKWWRIFDAAVFMDII